MRLKQTILAALAVSGAAAAYADSVSLPTSVHSPQSAPFNVFGDEVALATPTMCAVGARGADGAGLNIGAVDTFDLKVDGWTFIERLQPSDLAAGDQFGESVAANGSWLAVGAARHDASGADAGAVWVYRRQALNWRFPQKLLPGMGSDGARFGTAIAISASRIAVGAPGASPAGAVSVFVLVGETWQLEQTIVNPSPADGDRFGDAVAIEDGRLLIANPFEDNPATDRGAVFVYAFDGAAWQLESTLEPQSGDDRQYFGASISLKATRLAIGAYGADSARGAGSAGKIEVYDLVGGAWSRSAEIFAPAPMAGGNFGWDVALEQETMVVGEPGYGASVESLTGRAHLYARQPSSQWELVASIEATDPLAQDIFGSSVAISAGRVVVTAPGRDERRGALLTADFTRDCDQDGVSDALQIALDPSLDCNGDLVPDACQPDSDGDGVPNLCDCRGDLNGDGFVGSADLAFVLTEWGNYGQGPADITGDLRVDAQDITEVLFLWGPCGG